MIRGTSLKQPNWLDEPLDIVDEETLDSALMDMLTSDWQSLDDGEAPKADVLDDWLVPSDG